MRGGAAQKYCAKYCNRRCGVTGKEARAIVAGGLRFGDPIHIEAVELLERLAANGQNGPDIICTGCEDEDKPVKLSKVGCFLCAECTAEIEAFCDSAPEPGIGGAA